MAHPSRAAGPTPQPRPSRVVVCDGDRPRRDRLASSAETAGFVLVDLAWLDSLACGDGASPTIGIVHLGDGGLRAVGLAAIRELASRRVRVIAYGGHLSSWSIGAQCQVFLAGATAILDCSDGRFIEDLWRQAAVLLVREARAVRAQAEAEVCFARLGIVGASEAMHRLYDWTSRVAAVSDLHILLTGETGTGKQLFARALHQLDRKRRDGPFVAVNCGAISPGVAESELFGHRRGAYTGAEHARSGLFRAAQGGVLLLDEIGELEIGLQAKILRVLQEGRVLGVGEDREVAVDVRVVAATHRDLGEMVGRGTFRADLFHRLNGLTMHVPPVRERRGDVPCLVEHLLARHAERTGTSPPRPSPAFVSALSRIPLPGNVRELEHVVRHALAVAGDGAALDLPHLPAAIWSQVAGIDADDSAAPTAAPAPNASGEALAATDDADGRSWPVHVPDAWPLARSLAWCERAIVTRALEAVDGNQARAARLLGVTPRSVYNKLRKHHLIKRRA